MVEHSTVLPVIPRGVHQSVLSVLKGKPCYSDITSLISAYWWMFYYRADNLAEPGQLLHPLTARFAINGQSFFCVDHLGQKHIEVPLSSVRCLVTQKQADFHRPGLLVCEMKFLPTDEITLNCLTIWTINQHFFCSIAKYLFNVQPKRPKWSSPDKFVNSTFKGPSFSVISECEASITVNEMFLF